MPVSQMDPSGRNNLLLITAHPDDECMFFLPALFHFRSIGYTLHILCLSSGNADGLGPLRTCEMYYACSILGIPRECVTVVEDIRLSDGMTSHWDLEAIVEHVHAAAHKYNANTTITFDGRGVSYHPNHISTSHGVVEAVHRLRRKNSADNIVVWMLASEGLARKYSGFLDIPISLLLSKYRRRVRCCICVRGPTAAWPALRAHSTQFVWFRKLFVLFSSYIYVNTLIRV